MSDVAKAEGATEQIYDIIKKIGTLVLAAFLLATIAVALWRKKDAAPARPTAAVPTAQAKPVPASPESNQWDFSSSELKGLFPPSELNMSHTDTVWTYQRESAQLSMASLYSMNEYSYANREPAQTTLSIVSGPRGLHAVLCMYEPIELPHVDVVFNGGKNAEAITYAVKFGEEYNGVYLYEFVDEGITQKISRASVVMLGVRDTRGEAHNMVFRSAQPFNVHTFSGD